MGGHRLFDGRKDVRCRSSYGDIEGAEIEASRCYYTRLWNAVGTNLKEINEKGNILAVVPEKITGKL